MGWSLSNEGFYFVGGIFTTDSKGEASVKHGISRKVRDLKRDAEKSSMGTSDMLRAQRQGHHHRLERSDTRGDRSKPN